MCAFAAVCTSCPAPIFSASRCSHRSFALADSRFAWLHTPLRITSNHAAILPPFHALQLLRHAPSSFRWLASAQRSFMFVPQSLQAHLRLTELDLREAVVTRGCTSSTVSPAMLATILERHRKLLVLRLHSPSALGQVNALVLQSIFSLDRCHTLSLMPELDDTTSWAGLALMPALTALDMSDVGPKVAKSASRLHAVAQCTRLVHLCISRPRILGSDGFLRFFRQSNMARLRSLGIDQMDRLSSVPVADLQAAMAGMRSLQRLSIQHGASAHVLVQSLVSAPSLRELILVPSNSSSTFADPRWSSFDVLRDSLLHNPSLHLCVRLPFDDSRHDEDDQGDTGGNDNFEDCYMPRKPKSFASVRQWLSMLQEGARRAPKERLQIVFANQR